MNDFVVTRIVICQSLGLIERLLAGSIVLYLKIHFYNQFHLMPIDYLARKSDNLSSQIDD